MIINLLAPKVPSLSMKYKKNNYGLAIRRNVNNLEAMMRAA
jgi:hypothetical protein